MRIENLREEQNGDRKRISAMVIWEDNDRPKKEIYFETEAAFAEDLTCNPNAFLTACVIPALRHGEKRIFMEEEVCPELCDGLMAVMGYFRHWYDWYNDRTEPVRLETKTMSAVPFANQAPRTGLFLSGGIDSLASLRLNRLNYPPDHPTAIKDGIFLYGLDVAQPQEFDYVMRSLHIVAKETQLALIPIFTNARYLDDNWDFWGAEFQGAVLSSAAHALTKRLSQVLIAGGEDIPHLYPLGSHPLIDPNYSSADMRIRHIDIAISRIEKTELIGQWETGLQNIRVCTQADRYTPDLLNCGRCEKCTRTMLGLLATDKLEQTRAFPRNDVSPEQVKACVLIQYPVQEDFYSEMTTLLSQRGRDDLVRAIEAKLAELHEPRWKKNLKKNPFTHISEFDKAYLGGALTKLKKSIFPKG